MLGFILGAIVGAALGIVFMGIMNDVDYYIPKKEDEKDE